MIAKYHIFILLTGLIFSVAYGQQNLIGNGSFEMLSGNLTGSCPSHFTSGYVPCWYQLQGTSDIHPDAVPGYTSIVPYDGQRMAGCGAFDNVYCQPNNEAIMTDVDIKKNKAYILQFWAYYDIAESYPFYIQMGSGYSPATVCSVCGIIPISGPGTQTITNNYLTNTGQWQFFQYYFTAKDNFAQMIFGPYKPAFGYTGNVYIDKIELFEACDENWVTNVVGLDGPYHYGGYINLGSSTHPNPPGYVVCAQGYSAHLMAGENIILMQNTTVFTPELGDFFLAEIVPCNMEETPACPPGMPITVPNSATTDYKDIVIDKSYNLTQDIEVEVNISSTSIAVSLINEDITIYAYSLYSMNGAVLKMNSLLNERKLDMEVLSSGIYVLNLMFSDGRSKSFKILKQ